VAYHLPIGIAKTAMKLTFTGDKNQIATGHIQTIEDL
jgi:hypothetical protein